MSNPAIFIAEKKYYFKDIVNTIKSSGVRSGDTVMVHADLKAFGKLGDVKNKYEFANYFIDAFLYVLGEKGTLIVPTFTYSFCNNEIFNVQSSPSTVGLFTEELRKREGAFRSENPIFSVAAIGKNAKNLTAKVSHNCFGVGSIYDKLIRIKNSKYIIFGVNFFSCTLVHYIEETTGVPYRFNKDFSGIVHNHNKERKDTYTYYVRYLDKNVNPTFDKIESRLHNLKLLKTTSLGAGHISVAKILDIYKAGIAGLKNDPLFFLQGKPNLT